MVARVVRMAKKAASLGVLVVLTLGAGAAARWLGIRPDQRAKQFCAGPGVVARLAEQARNGGMSKDTERKPPLIQQAEAFAAYLNPPAPKHAAPMAVVRPRPARVEATLPPPPPVSALRLLGISYHRADPAESRALVLDLKGYRWVRQGTLAGEVVIEKINPRSIVCRGKGGMQEMRMEAEPGSVVPVQNIPVPSPPGGPDEQVPALAQNDTVPQGPEETPSTEAVSVEAPAPKTTVARIEPPKKETQESRVSPGRRPRPVRPVARKS